MKELYTKLSFGTEKKFSSYIFSSRYSCSSNGCAIGCHDCGCHYLSDGLTETTQVYIHENIAGVIYIYTGHMSNNANNAHYIYRLDTLVNIL